MRSITFVGLLAVFTSVPQVQAANVVVDFNEIPMVNSATTALGPNGYSVDLIPRYTYEENGFRFNTAWSNTKSAMQIAATTQTSPWWTGSQGLFHSYGGSAAYTNSFEVTRVNGGVFDLISLDVAAFGNGSRYFIVYGYPAGGGSYVQQYFPLLDDTYNTLETLTFGENFKNLTSVSFSAWGQQIDNVTFGVAAPVPEPENYAMLIAGLGLIGVTARRRSKAK